MNLILVLAFSTILSVWADENHGSHKEPPVALDHSVHAQEAAPEPRQASVPATEASRPQSQQRPEIVVTPDPAPETRPAPTRKPTGLVEGLGQGRRNCDEPCINCASDSSCKNTRAFDNSSESKEIPSPGTPSHTSHEGSSTSQQ